MKKISQKRCSECDCEIASLSLGGDWRYKVSSRTSSKSYDYAFIYQCSFTCYDHAMLRLKKDKGMSEAKRIKSLQQCEEIMTAQGKQILHPCNNDT